MVLERKIRMAFTGRDSVIPAREVECRITVGTARRRVEERSLNVSKTTLAV